MKRIFSDFHETFLNSIHQPANITVWSESVIGTLRSFSENIILLEKYLLFIFQTGCRVFEEVILTIGAEQRRRVATTWVTCQNFATFESISSESLKNENKW